MRTDTEHVDCGSCSKCCKGEFIPLTSGDDPANYPGIIHKPGMGAVIADIAPGAQDYYLPKGADGNCAYLLAGQCSIYDKRPAICRTFSCIGMVRDQIERNSRAARRAMGITKTEVYKEGLRRLREVGR